MVSTTERRSLRAAVLTAITSSATGSAATAEQASQAARVFRLQKRPPTETGLPKGTYVLHVEGGRNLTREYDSAELLVEVSPKARFDALLLTRRDPVEEVAVVRL